MTDPQPKTRLRRSANDAGVAGVRVLLGAGQPLGAEVAKVLAEARVVVDAVDRGEAVLDKLDHARYDVVLLDGAAKAVDAANTAGALRSREGLKALPVVVIFPVGAEADWQRCLEADVDDCLSSPIDPSTLRATVGRWAVYAHGVPEMPGGLVLLPRTVRGLDLAVGERQAGSRVRLAAMLHRLASWHRHAPEIVSNAAQARDWFTAERAIRIVRQVTAIAGAERTSTLAAQVEASIARRESGEALVAPLAAFSEAYAQLIEDLDREHAAG